jgi:hypothetical protein
MYEIKQWTENLDLTDFYAEAERRGFLNNSSQAAMIDCFRNEKEWAVWILYQNKKAIGSVASHSFEDVMGPGSYRVLARCCILNGARENGGLMTARTAIAKHQNLTNQFLLPTCIEWAGTENIYCTSHDSNVASQRLVHKHYFPTLEKIGTVSRIKEVEYRGHQQTVWKVNVDVLYNQLAKFPRWK